jgi:hypothetical protein
VDFLERRVNERRRENFAVRFQQANIVMMNIEKAHIKALLSNPLTRQAILERVDDEKLVSANIDDISPTRFDALYDAALDTLGNREVPVVKTYLVEGGYGDYPIEVIGVEGAFVVCALEHDDAGVFGTLEEAEGYVGLNWWGEARET